MAMENKSMYSNIRGVAAVEFAIVVPVLLMILFGIIAYGIFFGAANSLQQLAASSARAAMGGLDVDERQAIVETYVDSYFDRDGLLQREHLTVSVDALEHDETLMAVSVRYDAGHLPLWNIYGGFPLPERVIERRALIRAGGH